MDPCPTTDFPHGNRTRATLPDCVTLLRPCTWSAVCNLFTPDPEAPGPDPAEKAAVVRGEGIGIAPIVYTVGVDPGATCPAHAYYLSDRGVAKNTTCPKGATPEVRPPQGR
eukprot:5818324-Prymnesium_polylepis.1